MPSRRLDRSEFLRRLKDQFPAMKERLRGSDQGTHAEMTEFLAFTQEAINRVDREVVEHCFQFAHASIAEANNALKNALVVSYLEDLDFQGRSRAFALDLLTPRLAAHRKSVLEYLEKITGSPKWPGEAKAPVASKVKRRKHGSAA